MFSTIASTNHAPPFSNASVPKGDQRPARVVDHAQRSAVSLAVVPAPPSAVVRLSDVTKKGGTDTTSGLLPNPISPTDNLTAQGKESNGHDIALGLLAAGAAVGVGLFVALGGASSVITGTVEAKALQQINILSGLRAGNQVIASGKAGAEALESILKATNRGFTQMVAQAQTTQAAITVAAAASAKAAENALKDVAAGMARYAAFGATTGAIVSQVI